MTFKQNATVHIIVHIYALARNLKSSNTSVEKSYTIQLLGARIIPCYVASFEITHSSNQTQNCFLLVKRKIKKNLDLSDPTRTARALAISSIIRRHRSSAASLGRQKKKNKDHSQEDPPPPSQACQPARRSTAGSREARAYTGTTARSSWGSSEK